MNGRDGFFFRFSVEYLTWGVYVPFLFLPPPPNPYGFSILCASVFEPSRPRLRECSFFLLFFLTVVSRRWLSRGTHRNRG